MKKIINIILVVIWMIIVFLLSNQNSNVSSNTSGNFIKNFLNIFNINNVVITKNLQFVFRKLAHFTLYFIGGILSYNLFKDYVKKSILISFVFIVMYALSDELHQLFVDGRSMQLLDILIDSSGGIIGIILEYYIIKIFKRKIATN